MAQKPLNEMADTGYDNMGEESGYILHELKAFAKNATRTIEGKASKAELQAIWRSAELIFTNKNDFKDLSKDYSKRVDSLQKLEDKFQALSKNYQEKLYEIAKIDTIIKAVNINASRIDYLKTYPVEVEITPAELLTLNATPKELIPSPGAGRYIEIKRVEFYLPYATTAYTLSAGTDLSIGYETTGEAIQIETTGLLDQTANTRGCQHHNDKHPVAPDEAVLLSMLTGEVTLGDSPLKLKIDYKIVDVLT